MPAETAAREGTLADADFLLDAKGTGRDLGAWVVAAAFGRDGAGCGFALGDGTVRLAPGTDAAAEWLSVTAHDGAALALVPDCMNGLLSGGDDGRLVRIMPGGGAVEVAGFGAMRWVEHLATHPSGLRAAGVGKQVHLLDGSGARVKSLATPSTVGGLALDPKGKRVFASHYGGASVWFAGVQGDNPRRLDWKGSHHAISVSPDGTHVVTAMQENALHGWRLADGQHMRMSGYPGKTRSLSFTAKGRWLATSGSEAVILWPFFGGGPMGKQPQEIAGGDGVLCSAVACHPKQELFAAGFSDGLVLLAEISSGRVVPVAAPGRGAISALCWDGDGSRLAFGTEIGFAALVDMSRT